MIVNATAPPGKPDPRLMGGMNCDESVPVAIFALPLLSSLKSSSAPARCSVTVMPARSCEIRHTQQRHFRREAVALPAGLDRGEHLRDDQVLWDDDFDGEALSRVCRPMASVMVTFTV